ncbi:MAG: DUF1275 domain-containing protein [Deltaproteobacteria bacterium]|nr:DUF1275 domain-containing protein [Deltaproteobacteria bacterium]
MKRAERNTLLFILAITSGSADGWSYIGLGHAFVANMTGNTVLLGVSIFLEHHDVLDPLISLMCYATGVAFGSFLTRDVKEGSLWSKSTSSVLLVESLILFAAAVAWLYENAILSPRLKDLMLGCVATAIGLQSGAMLALKLPGIITTYITGTWTTLMSGLVLIGIGPPRVPANEASLEGRLFVQAGFLLVYFISAVATGWIFHYVPVLIGFLSAIPIFVVGAYGAIRG